MIGGICRELCEQFGLELDGGHALDDHVYMCLSIPPKFSVANSVGKLKANPRSLSTSDLSEGRRLWPVITSVRVATVRAQSVCVRGRFESIFASRVTMSFAKNS